MPDDSPQEINLTAQYYINKRIDKLAADLKDQHDDLKIDIAELKDTIVDNNKACWGETAKVELRVDKLEGFKNRAVGAVGIIVLLIGIWKVM